MNRLLPFALLLLVLPLHAQQEPDYGSWTHLLQTYYDPAHGMAYGQLKAHDAKTLEAVKQALGRVNVAVLTRKQQLAYWINVYNVNSVATIVESYPVDSIRDISTDPIRRLNVFSKERIPFGSALLSLDNVENDKIRSEFHDPRIHFAVNCAAKSCPPIRPEAYVGERVDAQLDDQVRKFLSSARYGKKGDTLVVHVTKIIDWFGKDFDDYGGGKIPFIRRYVAADKQKLIDAAKNDVELDFDDYDWALNDWKK